jgi:hypothetical protein
LAARVEKDSFHERMLFWFDKLGGAARFTTWMNGGLAARVEKDSFHERMLFWLDKLGGAARFTTWMNGGLAARMEKDSFHERMLDWWAEVGPESFVTLMNGSFCARVMENDFHHLLLRWVTPLGSKFQTIVKQLSVRLLMLGDAFFQFIRNKNWTQKMSNVLNRRVPKPAKNAAVVPVQPSVWEEIWNSA